MINWISFEILPIKNHLMMPVTEKRGNKTKYLTWNSIRHSYVKATSMPNLVKNLSYIKCCSLSSPRHVKSSSNSISSNCQKICSWSRRPKTILGIWKKPHFSRCSIRLWFTFQDFTNQRKKTNRALVFSCISFSNTNEIFQQSWKQDSFRRILKSSAGMY